MKRFNIFYLLLGFFLLASCSEDFLDSESLTQVGDANFYKTKKDAQYALVGCYDGLQMLYDDGVGLPVLAEVLSDNCYGGTGNTDRFNYQVLDEFDQNRSAGELNILEGNWNVAYKALYRCNMLLKNFGNIAWEGDTAAMQATEAETRFIRAYIYFDMVRIWGKVPLLLEPKEGNLAQSPIDSIYMAIADDLKFAAEKGSADVEAGHANKWAAKSLLGRVFLFYTGRYAKADLVGKLSKAEALQHVEDVIAAAKYELIPDFKDLWPASAAYKAEDTILTTYAGKDNIETVFAIKYNITSDYDGNTDGNHWMVMLGMRTQVFPPYGNGWGGCTVLPSLYSDYELGDTRRDASIIGIEEEELDFDNADQREYTGYTVKKYTPMAYASGDEISEAEGAANFMIGQFQDYVVMRYSDVLLMAAELGSANAQAYFDLVRARAGLDSKPATIANIMAERRMEFAFEGLRYWDLLRQGLDVAAEAIANNDKVLNGGVAADKVITKSNVLATEGLQQIPHNVITRSGGVLKQNPGW